MLTMSRSSYYYKTKERTRQKQIEDSHLRDRIENIIYDLPGYGSRRITQQLKRDGIRINRKRVQRIMKEHSLSCIIKRKWLRTTDRQ